MLQYKVPGGKMNKMPPLDVSEEEEIKIWKKYKAGKDDSLKDYFTIKYSPLVKYVAGKIAGNVPDNVEFDDLVGFGTFGLLDAINKYDPHKGIKFKTYGITRIRGQIYDELRNLDWVPRSVRQKYKLLEEENRRLKESKGRPATIDELVNATGISRSEVERITNMTNDSTIASLDDVWYLGSEDDEISVMDTVPSPETMNPDYVVEREEIRKTIAEEIQKLPEKEKQVLILYYYEDLTLKEIGAVLDVTESRVSQLHTKAIRHIRSSIDDIKRALF
jgi:RNA polymerase sigma factor for flagellar operon FliA